MILEALVRLYDRLAADGGVPPYGFSHENVAYAVVLDWQGRAVGVQSLMDTTGAKPRPSRQLLPRAVKRSTNVKPNFLWDNTGYLLGMARDDDDKPAPVLRGEHDSLKDFHAGMLQGTGDPGLRAVQRFLASWRPEDYAKLPHAADMAGTNVAFMLENVDGLIADRPAARDLWERHVSSTEGGAGWCLATGERNTPIARLHPSIRGVTGAPSTGTVLVTANEPAFRSRGARQGLNSPVSELAAFKYGAALNALLARGSSRRVQIGDTTVVFWAEAARAADAQAAETVYLRLNDPPADDEAQATQVRDWLRRIARGQGLRETRPGCEADTRFYVLGLQPNRARLAVQFWHDTTIGDLARRLAQHWADLRLDPEPWLKPPTAWRLLLETTRESARKTGDVQIEPGLVEPLTRAIFTGGPYPQCVLVAVLRRLSADGKLTGMRAAILKACLRRAQRTREPLTEDNLVKLDETSENVPYLLGRLFAVFVYAEKAAAKRNTTIADKWLNGASSAPSRTFPNLMQGFQHNLSKLRKDNDRKKQGSARRADQAASEITWLMPAPGDLPSFMPPEDKARFFVGYYQQERTLYTETPAADAGSEKETA
ncbi:MAG: type I-C CRISPR-associated protein Cas8c/Csd1 [Acidobacteria bacterium]|nr:type I-C CRISPR-associated protein Cas8c/Csd1 [Acidobacteriota bacterium]